MAIRHTVKRLGLVWHLLAPSALVMATMDALAYV